MKITIKTLGIFILFFAFSSTIFSQSHIYWTDNASNNVRRGNHDGTGVITLVSSQNTPRGIELDVPNNKMFWVGLSLIVQSGNCNPMFYNG